MTGIKLLPFLLSRLLVWSVLSLVFSLLSETYISCWIFWAEPWIFFPLLSCFLFLCIFLLLSQKFLRLYCHSSIEFFISVIIFWIYKSFYLLVAYSSLLFCFHSVHRYKQGWGFSCKFILLSAFSAFPQGCWVGRWWLYVSVFHVRSWWQGKLSCLLRCNSTATKKADFEPWGHEWGKSARGLTTRRSGREGKSQ